jgi:hypothetical protein
VFCTVTTEFVNWKKSEIGVNCNIDDIELLRTMVHAVQIPTRAPNCEVDTLLLIAVMLLN